MSSQQDLITFIIPTFNRSKILPESIKSILAQTEANWELIVVDDGSNDDTKDVVKPYLLDKRIKYFYQDNSGVSSARNYGSEKAAGEYLIFLDSDDTIYPKLIEVLNDSYFQEYDIICWEVLKKIDEKTFIQKPSRLGKLFNDVTASFLAGSICYKKSIFEAAGQFDEKMKFGENYELGLRISEISGLKIQLIAQPLLFYSVNSKTRTSNSLDNRLISYLHQYNKHQKKYKRNKKAESLMIYLIGYAFEKSGDKSTAIGWYKKSWSSNLLNLKPMLKLIYLNTF